jgi:hypothetical protein
MGAGRLESITYALSLSLSLKSPNKQIPMHALLSPHLFLIEYNAQGSTRFEFEFDVLKLQGTPGKHSCTPQEWLLKRQLLSN